MPLLELLLRIFAAPLANVFQKRICDHGQSPLIANLLTYLLLAISTFPWAFQIPWSTYPATFWLSVVMVGLCGGIGNGFLVQAIRCGELSVLGPINAYKSVIGIITGIVLLGEMPGIWGGSGVLLIIIGSYFVLDALPERFSWKLLCRKEFRYRFTAMVLTAVEAVFIKKVILLSNPTVAFVVWCWSGTVCSLLLLPLLEKVSWKPQISLALSQAVSYLALVLCVGVMQFATNYVFNHIPVGYALALFQLSALLSVVFGYCFFGETSIVKKLCGSAVMILGSAMIILKPF